MSHDFSRGLRSSVSSLAKLAWILAVGILVTGCDRPVRHQAIASESLQLLHQNIQRGGYHDIYASAASELRQSITEEQLSSLLQSVNQSLGPVAKSHLRRYMAKLDLSGFVIYAEFDTEFAKGQAVEQSAWRIDGERGVLVAYHIEAPQLTVR